MNYDIKANKKKESMTNHAADDNVRERTKQIRESYPQKFRKYYFKNLRAEMTESITNQLLGPLFVESFPLLMLPLLFIMVLAGDIKPKHHNESLFQQKRSQDTWTCSDDNPLTLL